jgi:hypothetical protein
MTSQPDKFFRDKFENYKRTPPPLAWSRIESNVQKKSKARLKSRYAIAATIILAISVFTIWLTGHDATSKSGIAKSSSIIEKPILQPPLPSPVSQDENQITSTTDPKDAITTVPKIKASSPATLEKETDIVTEEIPIATSVETRQTVVSVEIPLPSEPVQEIESSEPPIIASLTQGKKLHYSPGEIRNRFLKNQSDLTVTKPGKQEKGFNKILAFAGNINYATAYGDLRQLKNEILSFPSKSEEKNQ